MQELGHICAAIPVPIHRHLDQIIDSYVLSKGLRPTKVYKGCSRCLCACHPMVHNVLLCDFVPSLAHLRKLDTKRPEIAYYEPVRHVCICGNSGNSGGRRDAYYATVCHLELACAF